MSHEVGTSSPNEKVFHQGYIRNTLESIESTQIAHEHDNSNAKVMQDVSELSLNSFEDSSTNISSVTLPEYSFEDDAVDRAINSIVHEKVNKYQSAKQPRGPARAIKNRDLITDRRVLTAPVTHNHAHQHLGGGISPRVQRKMHQNPEGRQRTRTNSKRGTMDKLNMSSDDVEQLRQAFLLQSASSLSDSDAMIPRMSFCIPHRFQISPAKFFSHSTCGHCAKKPNYKQKAWKCTECAMVAHDECKSHILPKCGLRDLDLGVNLQTNDSLKLTMVEAAARQGRYIPFIVEALLMKINKEGVDQEGIYRVSGTHTEVTDLLQMFTYGKPNLHKVDVHSCTGLLKKYFREIIPEPLLTYELHDELIRIVALPVESERAIALQDILITRLPQVHFDVLCVLMAHFHTVVANHDTNKMSLNNISTIFGPTLMRSKDNMTSISCSGKHVMVVANLLKINPIFWNKGSVHLTRARGELNSAGAEALPIAVQTGTE